MLFVVRQAQNERNYNSCQNLRNTAREPAIPLLDIRDNVGPITRQPCPNGASKPVDSEATPRSPELPVIAIFMR
jgi:hypothetical protein